MIAQAIARNRRAYMGYTAEKDPPVPKTGSMLEEAPSYVSSFGAPKEPTRVYSLEGPAPLETIAGHREDSRPAVDALLHYLEQDARRHSQPPGEE